MTKRPGGDLVKNAFNQEANFTASQMITSNKLQIGNLEKNAVHESRQIQTLKTKKPEQMLLDLRNKKISEMNAYKDKETDRKVSDI